MMTYPATTVRRATIDDLDAIVQLIRMGDERDYDDEDVAEYIQRLDPAYSQAWMAIFGERPVGMTMTFRRTLQAQERQYTASYWANLFIEPDYRNLMLYPRLLHAKFSELKHDGIDFMYALVRRPKLIEAHMRIGFAKIADVTVMVKPLRPGRLATKYKALPRLLTIFFWPIDGLFAVYLRLRQRPIPSDLSVEEVPWDSTQVAGFAELLNDSCTNRIGRVWTPDTVRRRYTVSLDGDPYVLLTARRKGRLVAAIVYRTADRDRSIRMGIIMDLAFRDKEESAARAVLGEVQWRSYAAGADGMMYLDGLGLPTRNLVTGAGYIMSHEKYALLLWPKIKLSAKPLLGDISSWRLAFGEHDAF